jgi:hypothetical protein
LSEEVDLVGVLLASCIAIIAIIDIIDEDTSDFW